MAKIYIKYDFSAISSPYIILVCVENSAPLAEVGRIVLSPGSYAGGSTFSGINPTQHTVKYYQSGDGSALGSLIGTLSVDATIYNEPQIEIITFQVDAGRGEPYYDPAAGDNSYSNPSLAGCTKDPEGEGDKFVLYQEGLGMVDPSYIDDSTNGFTFNTDKTFQPDERYQIIKYVTVSTQPQELITRPFADIIELDADITFGSTHYNSFIRADFAGSVGTITFPAHASVPNYTRVKISTHGGSQNYLVLQFNGSETVKFCNQNKNKIYLAKCEEIELHWKDGVCYVVDYKGAFLNRGNVVASYAATSGPFLPAHVDTGVLYKTDYPGLYAFIESLPVGTAVALANWNDTQTINGETKYVNRSRYGIDTITETFRVPHLANLTHRFLKASGTTDTERVNDVAGGYQADELREHDHTTHAQGGIAGSGGPYFLNRAAGSKRYAGAGGDNFGGGTAVDDTMRTSEDGGIETRMENYGQIPLIQL